MRHINARFTYLLAYLLTKGLHVRSTYVPSPWHVSLLPNSHRRRRRDSSVELSRVGGVYTIRNYLARVSTSLNKFDVQRSRVASCRCCEHTRRQSWPSLQCFLSCWAIKFGDKWRHNDVIIEKDINIDQNSLSQTAMFRFKIVDRIRRQSSWASCELRSHRRRGRNSTRQLRRVGGVYWAYGYKTIVCRCPSPNRHCTVATQFLDWPEI